jgi:CheY-like chemotaxis protein
MARHSILIIDDDPDVRTALHLVLKKAGYDPLQAESGPAAIELMEQREKAVGVAAILCDLEMPGMSGASVIAHLHARHPMIPIVVLSGAAPTQFLDAVGQQGVGDWMRKPATNDMVLEKVRRAVHLYELRKVDRGTKDPSLT